MVTVYVPTGSRETLNAPLLFVETLLFRPIVSFVIVTCAPSITAPLLSVTVPLMFPSCWALTEDAQQRNRQTANTFTKRFLPIFASLSGWEWFFEFCRVL